MHIKQQIDDAIFLYQNRRYQGCLSVLMLAIGASSKKVFPGDRNDGRAFKNFLGSRIASVLWGRRLGDGVGTSGVMVNFREKTHLIEHVLYKYYRCALIHEGELPADVVFAPEVGMPNSDDNGSFTIRSGPDIVLDYGWLELLIKCVTNAECNGSEFGIKHLRELPVEGRNIEEVIDEIAMRHDTPLGRVCIMKDAIYHLREHDAALLSDVQLIAAFKECVESGSLNAGSIAGLTRKSAYRGSKERTLSFQDSVKTSQAGFCSRDGTLTTLGVMLLRDVAANFKIHDVGS